MFKITEQPDKKYTVNCYYYNENSHQNVEVWSATNLDEIEVAKVLQGRSDEQLEDTDFAFVVLKSGNGPAILTDHGNLVTAPVKRLKEITYGKRTVLSKSRGPKNSTKRTKAY